MNLVLPLPLNLANSRLHWRTKNREKKAYYKRCDNLMYFEDFTLPPDTGPMERVEIQATWYVHAKSDPDNIVGRLKWVLDWLVTRGYIVDDKAENVTLLPPVQHIDRKNKRLEIEITEGGDSAP